MGYSITQFANKCVKGGRLCEINEIKFDRVSLRLIMYAAHSWQGLREEEKNKITIGKRCTSGFAFT